LRSSGWALTIGSGRKLATPRIDLAQAHAVTLPPHPLDDQPDPTPVVEPRVQRAERRRLRWELDEAEGGGEEGAAGPWIAIGGAQKQFYPLVIL
jgi:hypothetical protein